jgi:hypothetical protein
MLSNPFWVKINIYVSFTAEKSCQKVWLLWYFSNICPKKTVTQQAKICLIWSPWLELFEKLVPICRPKYLGQCKGVKYICRYCGTKRRDANRGQLRENYKGRPHIGQLLFFSFSKIAMQFKSRKKTLNPGGDANPWAKMGLYTVLNAHYIHM